MTPACFAGDREQVAGDIDPIIVVATAARSRAMAAACCVDDGDGCSVLVRVGIVPARHGGADEFSGTYQSALRVAPTRLKSADNTQDARIRNTLQDTLRRATFWYSTKPSQLGGGCWLLSVDPHD